jgi:transcription initiation factor IIE alpha subunit
MTKIIFAMYNPETDCVEVSLDDKIHVTYNCQKCNASVHLNEPSDIAYLTRLVREEPGLYAKLAAKDGGLQGYIEAMREFN